MSETTAFRLRSVVARWYGDAPVGGVVAVVRLADGAEQTITVGHGDENRPLSADDVFRLGSITKTVIAVLVLQLAEAGKLKVSGPLADYLPEVQPDPRVTIRNLLQHTSGFADYVDESFMAEVVAHPGKSWEPEDVVERVDLRAPGFAPGSEWSYSNTNYILLGLVIERLSGSKLTDLVSEAILEKCGMASTRFPDRGEVGVVVGGFHDLTGDGVVTSLTGVPYDAIATAAWSAGGMTGTMPDLVRLLPALFAGQFITKATLEEMIANPWPDSGYALGIRSFELQGRTAWGHEGGIPGYATFTAHQPDLGITVALASNCPSCPPEEFATEGIGSLGRILLEIATSGAPASG